MATSTTVSVTASHVEFGETIRAGLLGGLVGGVVIWIYEAIVWVGVQHLMPLAGIPRNATGLVFGKDVQVSLGAVANVVGTGIHFFFVFAWGWSLRGYGPPLRAAATKRRSSPCSSPRSSGS